MKHDEQNVVIKNVLTEDEIQHIYEILKSPNNKYVMKFFTQTVSDFNLPSSIANKIIKYSEEISGVSGLEIAEYQFARYANVFDEESQTMLKPNLIPHCDFSFAEPRFTFDYQIGGNTSWPLVVEEKEFVLENNSALTFSGTHQVHWRKPKVFDDDQHIDMIFFHLRKIGSFPYSQDVQGKMLEKIEFYTIQYNEELGKIEGMHDYLAGFDKFNKPVPFYVEKPFSDSVIADLKSIIDAAKNERPLANLPAAGDKEEFMSMDRFDPRIMTHMSRMVIEFECPEYIEKIMDDYVLSIYKEPIKLGHYSYLDYNMKYGDGRYFPALPPHIDAANTLVTFNYCLDTNIDWDIYVDNVPYELKAGDALVFSAINQVHWRPKREWKSGDFCEIMTFDYSPLDDWRFTNGEDPLDLRFHKDRYDEYMADLRTRPEFIDAWELYNELGLKNGISIEEHGKIVNG